MKETHFLSKIYFQKMQWSNSEMVNARAFKPLPLCSAPLKNLLVENGALGNERNPLSKQNIFSENAVDNSETVNARAFKPLSLCSAPLKNLVVGITGALEMKETHFLSKNIF